MDKINISMIEPVGGHGGMNYYDFSLSNGLNSTHDCNVILYTCDETKVEKNNFEVKTFFRSVYGNRNKYIRGINLIRGLLRSLIDTKKNKTKIVHYHFFHSSISELLFMLCAKLFLLKVVITAHDVESFSKGSSTLISKFIYKLSDAVIAHNKVSKNELERKLNLPATKIRIIPHGNYLDAVNPNIGKTRSSRELNLSLKDEKILLFFGQIKEVKGLDLLIKAMPKIVEKQPNIKLVIAGKPWKDDFKKYEKLIEKSGLVNHFILNIGYVPDWKVDYYFNVADLVVLPYKKIYQSGVLLNAMSYKVPVVASNLDGMIEIIKDKINGFLFETGQVDALALSIIQALNDDDNLNQVAERAYLHVKEKHDWNKIARETRDYYKTLI